MSPHPKVSVIVPNYNHGHYLTALLLGLDQQNPKPFEVIVIDDKSSDNSVSIISDLQKRYPYIRLICHEQNEGAIATLNQGIHEANGDYLVFRAADDLDLPGYFETALQLLEGNPGVDLFCCDLNFFTNTPEDGIVEPVGFSATPTAFPKQNYPLLLGTRWVNGHTVMIRTEAMKRSGPFLAETAFLADWFHFMVAGFRGGFCYAPQAKVAARVSPHSYSSRKDPEDKATLQALSAMLYALLGPYEDTLDSFIESGALLRFGSPLAKAIRSNRQLVRFLTVADRIEQIQTSKAEPETSYGLESAIFHSLSKREDLFFEYISLNPGASFWIYGAGGHTRALLKQWKKLKKVPPIKGILVSDTPSMNIAYGLPLHCIDSAPFKKGDAVILSSKSYEGVMAIRVREIESLACVAIWNQNLDTLN